MKLAGHPIHPMLIPFPLGLLSTALVFDLAYVLTRRAQSAVVAFWMLSAGIIGAFLAAPFGLFDWIALPPATRAKRIGWLHGGGNVVVVLLVGLSWLLRRRRRDKPTPLAIGFSAAGVALATVTGWLGGELVDRLGVGVDQGAHLDSPNSLSGRPASEESSSPSR